MNDRRRRRGEEAVDRATAGSTLGRQTDERADGSGSGISGPGQSGRYYR